MLFYKCLLAASLYYKIPPEIPFNIARVESRYCRARQNVPNRNGSRDWGCFQINDITIEHYGLSKRFIVDDQCYHAWQGIRIMADLRQRFPASWVCRWNIGTAKINDSRNRLCKKYLKLLNLYAK